MEKGGVKMKKIVLTILAIALISVNTFAALGDIFAVGSNDEFRVTSAGNVIVSGDITADDITIDNATADVISVSTITPSTGFYLPIHSSLPTGVTTGYMLILSSDWKVYVATENAVGNQSYKALW